MRYIIDGYNFFFQLQEEIDPFHKARDAFIDKLTEYLASLNIRSELIFDSSVSNHLQFATKRSERCVDIIFSPAGTTADDYIIEKLSTEKYPQTVTVVSDDNGVLRRSVDLCAHTQNVSNFLQLLSRRKKKQQQAEEKLTEDSPAHLKRLHKAFKERLQNSSDEEGFFD